MSRSSLAVRRRSRGQSLVETALILPIFLVLVLGLLDVGRVVYSQHTLAEAAREAARFAVARPSADLPTLDEVRQRAVDAAPGVPITTSNVSVAYPPPSGAGQSVEVTITVQIDLITPLVGQLVGGSYTVTVRSVMHQL